ncbi:uncharacterized protein [Littorina saxatilis]|uniref:uncharacterized protein n=1 Tax=Littorina saxatilis TaxID=31220 RepID=UPI0038B5CABA
MDLHNSWNGDIADLSSTLPRLRQLVLSSDWGQVAQIFKDADRDTLADVEFILNRALGEQQWGCITALTTYCSLQQRSVVVDQAVKCGQWPCVLEAVKLGVAAEVKDALFRKAVDEGQWVIVMEITMLGVNSESRERGCERAVQLQQWDVVQTLVEMGLSCAVRSTVLKAAVAQRHVECAVKAMKLGVSTQDKEDALRQAVVSSQCHFLLELVKLSSDADMTDFVLREAVKRSEWALVEGLVGQGLGDVQKEHVLDEAVACGQWDLALTLLHDGVSPREWIVDELFRNKMGRGLVDQFPDGAMPSGLKGLMLMGAVKHSDGDIALHVIHHQSVSDAQLMEAIKFAVNLLDKEVLMQLLRGSPHSRRMFKYNFHKQQWKDSLQPLENESDGGDGGEVLWILKTLCENNEDDLALHVAVTQAEQGDGVPMQDFFEMKPEAATLKRRKIRVALGKLHDKDKYSFGDMVPELCTRSKEVGLLFRQALRMGDFSLALSLCGHGVQRKDLKFALPWFLADENPKLISDLKRVVNGKDRKWFVHYAARYGLSQYFEKMSEVKLKNFIALFKDCYVHDYGDLYRKIFRLAVTKAFKCDAAECFAEVCAVYFCHRHSVDRESADQDDFKFAFNKVLRRGEKELMKTSCEKLFKRVLCSDRTSMMRILMELVFKKKAWRCLPSLEAGLRELDPYGITSMLKLCLQKMLQNEVPWQQLAKTLCQWIKELYFGHLDSLTNSLHKTLLGEQWPTSVSSLAQWCVEKSHSNLAMVLGFVLADWQLVTSSLGQGNLDLSEGLLIKAAESAAKKGAYSAGVAVLKLCSLTRQNLRCLWPYTSWEGLAKACQKEGLDDWAVGLSRFDMKSMKEKLQTCHNQAVLDCVIETAAYKSNWDVVKEVLTRCSDQSVLMTVLRKAVEYRQLEITEALISRVDASLAMAAEYACGSETLLFMAVKWYSSNTGIDLIRLCIASGVSTFQRDIHFAKNKLRENNCPVLHALGMENLSIISLMLRSGATTNRRLYKIRKMPEMQRGLRSKRLSDTWKQGYKMIIKAASNPSRLEHLARLVVSHDIGCRPGRPDRIQALPVPDRIKDLVHFKDVLSCESETDPSMEVEDVFTGYPYFTVGSVSSEEDFVTDEGSDEFDSESEFY